MTSIGIIGSEGRMGVALAAAISEAGQRSCGVDRGGNVVKLASESDVLVDFSSPAALEATLDACVAAKKPIVIGTTGLEERHHYLIDDAARDIAVLQTGNTSLGVTLLAHLVREAAARLDPEYDIEIVEMHRRNKVDAPSGTALLLGASTLLRWCISTISISYSGPSRAAASRTRCASRVTPSEVLPVWSTAISFAASSIR